MDDFIDLDRNFVEISKDGEPDVDIGRILGRRYSGSHNWAELREHPRVVLLAEASSGKTAEFVNQARTLRQAGESAFCVRIEELADQGFEAALEPELVAVYRQWRDGTTDAWLFLDSLDEARLNRRSFETALKRLAREIGAAIHRACVFISCRVSDWKGREDRALIERLLPAWQPMATASSGDPETDPLLDPLFKTRSTQACGPDIATTAERHLLTVQLLPLTPEQCQRLAKHAGVADADLFMKDVERNGLDTFTERPGDVIDLAVYWRAGGKFAAFVDMVKHSVNRKLEERDRFRPDNDAVPIDTARAGAERVAATLTLGKSFTLRAPGESPDPSLAAGALDPALVLGDWTPAQQNTLLRRGVFAPATYGRLRFHHRETQEYLTAQWLHRLLISNCPRDAVRSLLFAHRYGVETVVPSLRPAAAWLALQHSDILAELLQREPLVLLRHGDAGSIPLEAKKQLLRAYANQRERGEISDDQVDHRSLWMFADPRLGDTIREIWADDRTGELRYLLLRLIREGAIRSCADLARSVALDARVNDVVRHVALEALEGCDDHEGLAAAAKQLLDAPEQPGGRLVGWFVEVLYPRFLTTDNLLLLMERSQVDPEDATMGLQYRTAELYEVTLDPAARLRLVKRIGELCLTPPFVDEYRRVSRRYAELASRLEPIARREVLASADREPSNSLIGLLMVVERAEHDSDWGHAGRPLSEAVQRNQALQRALFWADVDEVRTHSKRADRPSRYWQVFFDGPPLWVFTPDSLVWLYEDLQRDNEDDQRIALSAIERILRQSGRLDEELTRLRQLIGDRPYLLNDLHGYLAPRTETAEERQYRLRREESKRRRIEDQERAKTSWKQFRDALQANPAVLRDPRLLATWESGVFRLRDLTHWLAVRSGVKERIAAGRHWQQLRTVFGDEVAAAYRDGMKLLWRLTPPERPQRTEGAAVTTKWTTILSVAGIALEAVEDPEWASRLSKLEAQRAAEHACLSEQDYPEWFESLLEQHPDVALPILHTCVLEEWRASAPGGADFLNHYAQAEVPITPPLGDALVRILLDIEPREPWRHQLLPRLMRKLQLNEAQRRKAVTIARRRLRKYRAAGNNDIALRYLELLLLMDADRTVAEVRAWIQQVPLADRQAAAEAAFAHLWGSNSGAARQVLRRGSLANHERLLRLVYGHVDPKDDATHRGAHRRTTRDEAEAARYAILSALADRCGAEAHRALKRAAGDPRFQAVAGLIRELAHGMAERDTEPPPWNEGEVLKFEREHTAPIKSGDDLNRLVRSLLDEIKHHLVSADVSSRALLQNAADEEDVKSWIVEQLNLRSRARFHAYREAEVARRNKPDVIVSSTSAPCEIAIEVKHGGKNWTFKELEAALCGQLASNYLKPITRRHGILLVTRHNTRTWRDPKTGKPMEFDVMISRLTSIAGTLTENGEGPIEVSVVGIDTLAK